MNQIPDEEIDIRQTDEQISQGKLSKRPREVGVGSVKDKSLGLETEGIKTLCLVPVSYKYFQFSRLG